MVKLRSGFTLIEVSLFLAVTGLLFLGVTIGVQNSISQQRYNDAVQSFAEFLRNIYSEVTNVQHEGTGKTNRAVYGKMITFGETCNLMGESVVGGTCSNSILTGDQNTIYEYNVVGNAEETGTGGTLGLLQQLKAGVVEEIKNNNGTTEYALAGIVEDYTPKWQAQIERKDGGPFIGTVLIVRNPVSGIVSTFYSSSVVHVNVNRQNATEIKWQELGFTSNSNIDFCVNQNAGATGGFRRDVRIQQGARNASGVVVETDDVSRSVCGW